MITKKKASIKQIDAMKKARNAKRRYAEMYISQKATDPDYQAMLDRKSRKKAALRKKRGHMTEEQKADFLRRLRAKRGETD
jgi:hypothetical protein